MWSRGRAGTAPSWRGEAACSGHLLLRHLPWHSQDRGQQQEHAKIWEKNSTRKEKGSWASGGG